MSLLNGQIHAVSRFGELYIESAKRYKQALRYSYYKVGQPNYLMFRAAPKLCLKNKLALRKPAERQASGDTIISNQQ